MSADTMPDNDLDGDRSIDDLMADPVVAKALHAIGQRLPNDPCPRCLEAPIAQNSKRGFCQPCDTEQDERIKASRRRSYHRRKGLPTLDDTDRHVLSRAGIDPEVVVGEQGFRLLSVADAATVLGVSPRTLWRWIGDGTIRSMLLPPPAGSTKHVRRIPADAIVDVLNTAEAVDQEAEQP